MIIDAHTHIYPDHVAEKAISTILGNTSGQVHAYTNGTLANLLSSMDKADIDLSIVLTVATSPQQGQGIIKWLKQIINHSPRLIYFGSVHPADPDYKSVIREMAAMGLQGLKFHPAYQGHPADGKEAYRVYEEVAKNDLIMYFHSGIDLSMPDSDYATVERLAQVLKDFSGAKIIMAHAGGYEEWDKVVDLFGNQRCYYDTSFVLDRMAQDQHAMELYRENEDRFIFGSDSPWQDQKNFVDFLKNSDLFTPEQKDKLFYKNILKLIKA